MSPLYHQGPMQYNDVVDRLTMRPVLVYATLVAVTVATYVGALRGAFQFDDLFTILINPHLDRWGTFVGHLDHMVRPLLYATFLLDRSLYGNSANAYHLLNLLLHLGSGLLVYRILTRAVTEETTPIPFLTALLFLIHPIQTETVTYISGRASGLMAFGYLLALFLYIKTLEYLDDRRISRLYFFGAVTSFLLSLASKETAITFPLVLLLWDILVRRLSGASLFAAIRSHHLPFWLMLLVVGLAVWSHPRYTALAQFSFGIRPFWDNLLGELNAVTYALLLFFCPWKQNFDHDLPVLHSLFQWPLPFDLLVWCGLASAAFVAVRRLPLFSFGIGWFYVQLLPTSLIPRIDLLSERNLYLASIGLLLAVVVLGSRLTHWLTKVLQRPRLVRIGAGSLALAVVLALCHMTFQRNALYHDPVLLWSDTVEKSPQKARPHNNLGHAYALRDDWDRAIEEFRTAAKLDPDYALAQKNLRDAYLHQVGRQ
ncbi:MAG: tetratricopeptide repeat protein [Nitrospirae bacterium]|nr:MAG: tetratricopeptide repeat protein [Nitrospirota bacterium]